MEEYKSYHNILIISKKAPVRRLFEPEAFHLELLRSGKE